MSGRFQICLNSRIMLTNCVIFKVTIYVFVIKQIVMWINHKVKIENQKICSRKVELNCLYAETITVNLGNIFGETFSPHNH